MGFSTTSVYKTPTHNSQSSARNNQNKKWGRFELKLECRLQAKEFYHDKLVLCSLRESDDEILRQNAADRDEFEFDFFDDREEWEDISLAASEVSFEMLGDGEGNQSEEEEEDGGRPRSFKDALLHGLHDTGRKELKICAS